MQSVSLIHIVLPLAVMVSACGDSAAAGPQPTACEEGTTAVDAQVTVGASVAFDWQPACGVFRVEVTGSGGPQWGLIVPAAAVDDLVEANRITPRVVYGQPPTGIVEQIRSPEPLEAGARYELLLWRVVPGATAQNCGVDYADACLVARVAFVR